MLNIKKVYKKKNRCLKMANLTINILYVILFVVIIVFLDFKYFRYEFWKRLIVNILIVLVAVAFYYLFLGNL